MTDERARQLAYEWHGGMWSPLYAFASSGLVADPIELGKEIASAMSDATGLDLAELQALEEFVAEHVKPTQPGATWPHYAAPWARKEYTQ